MPTLGGVRDQTEGPVHAGQALHQLSFSPYLLTPLQMNDELTRVFLHTLHWNTSKSSQFCLPDISRTFHFLERSTTLRSPYHHGLLVALPASTHNPLLVFPRA